MSENNKSYLRQAIVIICASVLTAIIMSFIAPNGLRQDVGKLKIDQATTQKQVDIDTGRINTLEVKQSQLATKEDLQTLKMDLIRELKK
jgi:hypothetical protein